MLKELPVTLRAFLVAVPLVLLSGCGHRAAPPANAADSATSTTSATTDTTPSQPIVDSPAAAKACGSDHLPVGEQLVAAYDTTVGDIVGWQESHSAFGIWRQHNLSLAAWVCYTTYSDAYDWSQYSPPCAPPHGGVPASCSPHPTRGSWIVAADGEVQPAGWDVWLSRPPHLNGPPPPPRSQLAGP